MPEHDSTTDWNGTGWSVRRTAEGITARADDTLNPAAARELSTALHHAAWAADGELTQADWTHSLLIATLIRAGGSITLDMDQLTGLGAVGGQQGNYHGFEAHVVGDHIEVSVIAAQQPGR